MSRPVPGPDASAPQLPAARLRGLPPGPAAALREAVAQLARGALNAAELQLFSAGAIAPAHPEVLRWAGVLQRQQGRLAAARESLERAHAANPQDVPILIDLAAVCEAGADAVAAHAALLAAAGAAGTPETSLALALECDRQGYALEATALADRLLTGSGTHVVARLLRARCRQALGDATGSADDYRHLIAQQREPARAWFGMLEIKTIDLRPGELQALEVQARASGLDAQSLGMLEFALGRAYEQCGRLADAVATLDRANARIAAAKSWDGNGHARLLAAVDVAFAAPVDSQASAAGREVIFLVGLPRSGTTLFEQVLAAHPQVEGASELPYLQATVDEESARRRMPFPAWAPHLQQSDWDRLGQRYLALSARWRRERPIATDKLPENWMLAAAALRMLPQARVIDCRRDALETCWSCFKQLFAPGRVGFTYDHASLAAYWHGYVAQCARWQQRMPDRFRTLHYEALLADPEGCTRELLAFCGLPFDAACLRFHEVRRSVRSASAAQVRQPLRRDTARANAYGELLDPLRRLLNPEA